VLTDDLLELQRIDTASDQLRHRAARLAEREALGAATAAVAQFERRRDELRARLVELEQTIADDEQAGADLTSHRTRLEGQLRMVVGVREADALMHEIETIRSQRDALDDRELEHLEEQSSAQDELAALAADEPSLRSALAGAEENLATASGEIDGELARLAEERLVAAARLDPAALDRYERMRGQHQGVAVARLVGGRCDGCHLDLAAADLEAVRRTPTGELAECPHCGRLLVPG
jgi:predicted  nucleic acid-binding Zn-ribbon protein